MTIFARFKASRRSPKLKDVEGRLADSAASAEGGPIDAATSPGWDDAMDQVHNALQWVQEKVGESATLAKLQDEARHQLFDALELARDKVTAAAPLAKAKLEEAREEVMERLPHKRRRRSRLYRLIPGLLLVSAAIGVILVLKKNLSSPHRDSIDMESDAMWDRIPTVATVSGSNESIEAAESSSGLPPQQASAASSNPPGKTTPIGAAMTEKADTPDSLTAERLNALLGKDVVDLDGNAIGQITRIYYRLGEGQPVWAVVSGGLITEKKVTVPLADATIDEKVQVAYRQEQIEEAIDFEADEITVEQEMEADRHYNLHRETGAEAIPYAMLTDMTLRAWPPGFVRQEAD